MNAQPITLRIVYVAALVATGWFALGLQFYLIVQQALATGTSVLAAEVRYFSFFTILTNLLVALVVTAELLKPRSGPVKFLTRSTVQTAVAVYIIVVSLVYNLFLRNVWHPEGWQKIADELLHDVIPVAYVIYWLAAVPKGSTSWKDAVRWLSYPAVYAVYVLIRGAVSGSYPYPFVNAVQLGYPRVFFNMLVLLIAIVCLGWVIVAIDHLLSKRGTRNTPGAGE